VTHGTETAYVHWRCRCPRCRAAATEARRSRQKTEIRVGRERGAATRFKWDVEHERAQQQRIQQGIDEHDWALRKLLHDPAYRELIRQRVSEEQQRRYRRERSLRIAA
jgi:hypothetical protein